MKIAVLGGAFDPPHVGHFLVAEQVREILHMDEVWFLPCKKYYINRQMSEERHRLAMVNLMKRDFIKISEVELQREGTSYMIDTLNILTKQNSNNKYHLIIGSDWVERFTEWKSWKEIIKKHSLIIFPRDTHVSFLKKRVMEGFKLDRIPDNIRLIDLHNLVITNISSSKIRERIKKNMPIKYLVEQDVEQYISKNNLYK